MKRLALVAAAVAFVALGFVSTPAQAATTVDVAIVGNTEPFYGKGTCDSPGANSVTINVGDTVRWTNCDPTKPAHTVSSPSFDSGNVAFNGKFTHVFNASGFFNYHCNIHPDMMGTVVVQPPATTLPAPTSAAPTTTVKPTTTSSSTSTSTTQTTLDLSGVFDGSSTTSSSSTTSTTTDDSTSDDDGGSSSGLVVALLVLAIAGVGVGAYFVWRRVQQAS